MRPRGRFIFSPLTGLNETALPVYSGKVLVSASNGEELSVPYMGMSICDVRELRIQS